MIIENPDALKEWLTSYLPPLCDADPEVLAKYCLALVRKDRPSNELRASMIEQLDVFLKSNTELFVEKFLQVAKSKSYLPPKEKAPKSTTTTTSSPTDDFNQTGNSPDSTTTTTVNQTSENVGNIPSPTSNNISTTSNIVQPPLPPLPPLPPVSSIPYPPPETAPPYPPKKVEVSSTIKSRKSDTDRDKEERRIRRRSRSFGHSRSRSRDKGTRSRSRDRNRRSRSRGRRTKYDDRRRRSPHVKRYRRSRTRSRSPRWSRSPNRTTLRARNRSRSHSPAKRHHRSRTRSPLPSSRPSSPVSKGSPKIDDKDKSPSPEAENSGGLQSIISVPSSKERYERAQRCRDYDVQGFCMRGDQCPFDHGADRVVLEGGAIDFPPPLHRVPPPPVGYPLPGVPRSALSQDIPGRRFLHPPPPRPTQFGEYTPNNPGLWVGDAGPTPNAYFGGRGRGLVGPPPRFPAPPPPITMPNIDRELISVPVDGTGLAKHSGIRLSLAQRLGPAGSTPVTGSTSYPNVPHIPASTKGTQSDNCTLELRKIPQGLNTISHLNQHFSKFGTIINIQVQHGGDKEAALVTFSSNPEASAAYRSTEAVFNNRFIKLFWHNPSKSDVFTPTIISQRTVHDRLTVRNPNKSLVNKASASEGVLMESSDKVIISGGSLVKTVYNPTALKVTAGNTLRDSEQESSSNVDKPEESKPRPLTTVEMKKQEIEAIRRQQELLKAEISAKQKVEKQKCEALKLRNEVESRAKQLLKEQMQHVKLLINKLEKNKATMKPEEISKMMETIKSLQAAVENTKAQLVSNEGGTSSQHVKTKPQLNKEILDTELELYTLQCEGRDITHVRTRLHKLKSELALQRAKFSKSYITTPAGTTPAVKPVVYVSPRGRGISRGIRGFRSRGGRGRGYKGGGMGSSVDRRTTCINASGFEREDKDQVLAHFASLGTVVNYSWDDLTPSVSLQYSNRKEAEKAMTQGRTLEDRLLTLTWVAEQVCFPSSDPGNEASLLEESRKTHKYTGSTPPHSTASVISNEDVEEITEEIVEEETEEIGSYVYEDELDEEEDEGRSWRR